MKKMVKVALILNFVALSLPLRSYALEPVEKIDLAELLKSTPEISLKAQTGKAFYKVNNFASKIYFNSKSDLELVLRQSGLYFSMTPGLQLQILNPLTPFSFPLKISLKQIIYDFKSASFKSISEVNYKFFGLSQALVDAAIEALLNQTLKKDLPSFMQKEGFNPYQDVSAVELKEALVKIALDFASSDESSKKQKSLLRLYNPTSSVTLFAQNDYKIPLVQSKKMLLSIDDQSVIRLSAKLNGEIPQEGESNQLQLESMSFEALSEHGLMLSAFISKKDKNPALELELKKLDYDRSMQAQISYDLEVVKANDLIIDLMCHSKLSFNSKEEKCSDKAGDDQSIVRKYLKKKFEEKLGQKIQEMTNDWKDLIPLL